MSREHCIRYRAMANTDTWARSLTHHAGANSWNEGIWGSSDRSWNRESDRETEIRALRTKLHQKDKAITLLVSGYSKQSEFLSHMGFTMSAGEIVVDRSLPWTTDERARLAEDLRAYVRSQITAESESADGSTTGSRNRFTRAPGSYLILTPVAMSKPTTNSDPKVLAASQASENNHSGSESDTLTQTVADSESNELSEDHKAMAVTLTDFLSSLNWHLQEVYRGMGVHVAPYSTPDNSYLGVKFSYPQLEHTLVSDPNAPDDNGVPATTDGSGEQSTSAGGGTATGPVTPSEGIRRKITETAWGISSDDDHLNSLLEGYPLISGEDALKLKQQGASFEILKSGLERMDIEVEVTGGQLLLKTPAGSLPQYASFARLHGVLSEREDLRFVLSSEVEDLEQSEVQGDELPDGQDKDGVKSCVMI